MSEQKKELLSNFLSIHIENLDIDSSIPFDCFIYLEKNKKIVHWLKKGTVFSPELKDKLLKFEENTLFIQKSDEESYNKYLAKRKNSSANDSEQTALKDKSRTSSTEEVEKYKSKLLHFGLQESKLASRSLSAFVKNKTPEKNTEPSPPSSNLNLRVDAKFLNVLIASTQAVFADVSSVEIKFNSTKKRAANAKLQGQADIASFIPVTSDSIRGTIGLCLSEETYLNFLKHTLKFDFTHLTPELAIGIGEFIFRIFEVSRPNLRQMGYSLEHGIPYVVAGKDLPIPYIIPDPGFSLLFDSICGPLQFEIGIKTGL